MVQQWGFRVAEELCYAVVQVMYCFVAWRVRVLLMSDGLLVCGSTYARGEVCCGMGCALVIVQDAQTACGLYLFHIVLLPHDREVRESCEENGSRLQWPPLYLICFVPTFVGWGMLRAADMAKTPQLKRLRTSQP
jgi:hypothetical protein